MKYDKAMTNTSFPHLLCNLLSIGTTIGPSHLHSLLDTAIPLTFCLQLPPFRLDLSLTFCLDLIELPGIHFRIQFCSFIIGSLDFLTRTHDFVLDGLNGGCLGIGIDSFAFDEGLVRQAPSSSSSCGTFLLRHHHHGSVTSILR